MTAPPRGQHIFSAAVTLATQMASDSGQPPDLDGLAQALGVPRTALLQVIPDRTSLVNAMAESGYLVLLHTATQGVAAVPSCPLRQFEALADAYVEWAYRHPHTFRFIGTMPADHFEANPHLLRYERSIHDLMRRMLRAAQDRGLLDPQDDPDLLIAIAHTFAYGVISKMLLGDLARWRPGLDERDAARLALRVFADRMLRPPRAA